MRWRSGPCLPKPQKWTNQIRGEAVDYPSYFVPNWKCDFFSKIIQKQKWNPIPNQRLGDFKNTEVPNQVSSWMGVVPTSGVVPKRSFGPNDQTINGRGNRAPGENWPKKTLLKFDPGWNKMIAF